MLRAAAESEGKPEGSNRQTEADLKARFTRVLLSHSHSHY